MIVKNESATILRVLNSAKNIIGCYCICDTGSTDNTIELITNFGHQYGIPGKIIKDSFVNFEHNRNAALENCRGMSDYILLLDADMELQIGTSVDIHTILSSGENAFCILQGDDAYYYKNVRIIKNDGACKYVGVTHEYLATPRPPLLIKRTSAFIRDHGDGGCKADKFDRDIRLLTTGLETDPQNMRYMFYLANSYFCKQMYKEAIDTYKKRTEGGGWEQEIWYSFFRMGSAYMLLDRPVDALYSWMEAHNACPNRIENIYEMVKYYRTRGHNKTAMQYYNMAANLVQHKDDNFLFLQNDIYTHKLFYEYSILAYYNGVTNVNDTVVSILNAPTCPHGIKTSVVKNNKYYDIKICPPVSIYDFSSTFIKEINGETITFTSSSACFLRKNNTNFLNVRFVNYLISPTGKYLKCDKNIITINKCFVLDDNMMVIFEWEFEIGEVTRKYAGIEDIRIFNRGAESDIEFIGTGYHKNNTLGIVTGKYDVSQSRLCASDIQGPYLTPCEKNWAMVQYKNRPHLVYAWGPDLQIGIIENNKLSITERRTVPPIFNSARGSTNGHVYNYNNIIEIWFIVHIVSYETPRKYYHMFVVCDIDMNMLRYSAPFVFEKPQIEYCLSIYVDAKRVIIPHSTRDRTTILAIYDKTEIDKMIVYSAQS